jgi:hypothetical protein
MTISLNFHDLIIFEGDENATKIEMRVYNPIFRGKIIKILNNGERVSYNYQDHVNNFLGVINIKHFFII